jgi:hypothetical protein
VVANGFKKFANGTVTEIMWQIIAHKKVTDRDGHPIDWIQLLRKWELERDEKWRLPTETFSEMERGATQGGPLFRFKHHGAIFTIGTERVLEKLQFFQSDRSRLDAGECEVASPVPSEAVASFVKMVEGKPVAITEEDFIPLLVLSDEFGFQELSDACLEFANESLFRVGAEQRHASERCRESGVDWHQAWTRGAEFFRGSAE